MSIINSNHKRIVTAFLLTVMFSLPLQGQEVTVDQLFDQLQNAPADQADKIEDKIIEIWSRSGSPSMDLLLERGRKALDDDDSLAAIEHLTALIDHAPDFAEAYNMRATAYFDAGYFGPAMADLRRVLALNPRHFGAMTGVAVILESSDEPQKALKVYRQVQKLLPHDKDITDAIARLQDVAL
ncbi:MAG TPA: hypothetical protein ENJ91_03570 [Rhodobacteraceae bacterium]|nr:hypothetical protein [Paracoccaceae bacterium]